MDILDKCDNSYAVWIYNFLMSLFSITFFGAWFNFYLIWSLIGWAVVIWVALQHNPYQFKLCSCNMPYWLSLFFSYFCRITSCLLNLIWSNLLIDWFFLATCKTQKFGIIDSMKIINVERLIAQFLCSHEMQQQLLYMSYDAT